MFGVCVLTSQETTRG